MMFVLVKLKYHLNVLIMFCNMEWQRGINTLSVWSQLKDLCFTGKVHFCTFVFLYINRQQQSKKQN